MTDKPNYVLKLFVAGSTPGSARAIVNVRKLCEEYIPGHYQLEVVDIVADPSCAKREQLFAAPTLIKTLPLPIRRFIGDMSRSERLIVGLDLETGKQADNGGGN